MVVVEWNKRRFPPFPCCPVSRQCSWKKNLIEKIQTHIPSVWSLTDILLLKSVYDNIEAQICSLENLGAKSDIYVPLLMSLLQLKIQNELNLISWLLIDVDCWEVIHSRFLKKI